MNPKITVLTVLTALALGLAGCQEKSPKLVGTPPTDPRKATGNEVQTLSAKVDILFVIDDSGSMQTHQTNLATNVDKFLAGLQTNRFIDYHIGVISTSEEENTYGSAGSAPGAGRLSGTIKYVDKSTPNGIDILKTNMLIGTWGSATERMFSPVKQALTVPNLTGWNLGFYRPDAFLAVVFITDAEDQSEVDYGYPSRDQSLKLSPQGFYDFLVDLKKGNKRKIATYGAIVPLGVPNSVCPWDGSEPAIRLDEFYRISKGISYSLCDLDYGTKLSNIGQDLVGRIGRSILLDRRPDPETIEVFYGTQVLPRDARTGWAFDPSHNTVTFGREVAWTDQPPGTEVEVTFRPLER